MAKCNTNGKGKMKTKYADIKAAEKALLYIWGNDSTVKMGDLHVYKCLKCGTYHVGHKLPKAKTKKESHETTTNDQIGA